MSAQPTGAPERVEASGREQRRQNKMRQIVEAARDVFLQEGFSGASVDAIVQKAGVSKRTLYSYYASKEEIFIDVMQTQLGVLYRQFEAGRKRAEPLADRLRRIGIELLRIANSPQTLALFRITAAEASRFPALARLFFEERFEKVIDGIAALLDQEAANSGLRLGNTRQAGEHFLDLVFGTAYHRVVFGTIPPMDDKAIEARVKRALDYFLEAQRTR